MEPCVFCQRTDRPMTREHVFARWLIRRVHGGRLISSEAPRAPIASSTASLRIGRVVASVCAECNAGWMSTLEVSLRGALFERPRAGPIPASDRTIVGRWLTKTAVLLAHARGATLLAAGHRAQLVAGMPDGVEVFLARRRRPPQRLDFVLDMMADSDAARSVAILVDDLVGHVAAPATLTSRHGTRLWPLRTHLLRWETLPVISPLVLRR